MMLLLKASIGDRYQRMLARRSGGDRAAMAAEDAKFAEMARAQTESALSDDQTRWHGHVRRRDDGLRARCGGPGMCFVCKAEQVQFGAPLAKARPTPAQASAGNYKKPRRRWQGLEIAIENPVGSIREGRGWRTKMANAYGYVCRSEGVDGDEVDVYLGPELDTAPMVYVVHQRRAGDWKAYDEDKVMLGFESEAAAREAYLKHYDDPRFLGPITAMPVDEFVRKVRATYDKPAMIKAVLFLRKPLAAS